MSLFYDLPPSLTAASTLRGRLMLAVAKLMQNVFCFLIHTSVELGRVDGARRTPCPAHCDINSRRSYLWAAARTSLVRVFRTGKGESSSSRSLTSLRNRFSELAPVAELMLLGVLGPPQFILVGHVRSPRRSSSLHVPGTATSPLPASTRCLRPRRTRTADE